MAERLSTIRVTHRYSAPAARVFDAWLDPETAGKWLFATASRPMALVAIDARVDGSFRFVERLDGEAIEYSGEYLEITRPKRLAFTLSVGNEPQIGTRVVTEIVPLKTGCRIRLVQHDLPPDCVSRAQARWTGILYGLGVTLEADKDRRRKGPIRIIARGAWRMSSSGPAGRLSGERTDSTQQEMRPCDS